MAAIIPSSDETGSTIKSKEDIISVLSEEEPKDKTTKVEEEDVEEIEEDEEDETDNEDELEDEDEETEEEEELKLEEETTLDTPFPKKALLAKYPNVLKDFPYLEKAYYRDQQFSEVFPTPEDAKEAATKSESLDEFESSLLKGDTVSILKLVKERDEDAFNVIADNYLTNLYKVDEKAYFHVAHNLIKDVISGIAKKAKEADGDRAEELIKLATGLNEIIFNTKEYSGPTKLSRGKEGSEETDKIKKEREEFVRERYEISVKDLSERTDNVIKRLIDGNIDKTDIMTPYIKRNATKDVMSDLEASIGRDNTFRRAVLDPLWKKAAEANFSRTSLDLIEKAYLSRAKSMLLPLIKKARKEALKGMGKRDETVDRRGPISKGHSASSVNKGRQTNKGEIPKGMNPKDFIMAD